MRSALRDSTRGGGRDLGEGELGLAAPLARLGASGVGPLISRILKPDCESDLRERSRGGDTWAAKFDDDPVGSANDWV